MTMPFSNAEARITHYLVNKVGIQLSPGTRLISNGLLDSLAVMELIDFVENEFSIKLESEEMIPENFDSVEVMAALIQSKQN